MQIIVKCNIPEGEFPKIMHNSEITEYIKQKMQHQLSSYISENTFKMMVCDHNTAEVSMKSIFIEDANGFLDKVNILLDDPGMSKKDFRECLIKLISELPLA